ncbi:MAG: hypothetical protein HW403_438 [Dehalococcoidia bacterium]|nr:hypothetical protein [Dehalococcoidia bacterium]
MRVYSISSGTRIAIGGAGLVAVALLVLVYALLTVRGEMERPVTSLVDSSAPTPLEASSSESDASPSVQEHASIANSVVQSETSPQVSSQVTSQLATEASSPTISSGSIKLGSNPLPKKVTDSSSNYAIKGVYIPYFAIQHLGMREHVFKLLETTELNAVVIPGADNYARHRQVDGVLW